MYTKTVYPVINLAETGRRIERQRRQAGLTVRDLQTYFGFEYPQAIYKWQHGECLPTVDNLLALARLLRVSMEDLLVYDDRGGVPLSGIFLNHEFNDMGSSLRYSLCAGRGEAKRKPSGGPREAHLRLQCWRKQTVFPGRKVESVQFE